MQHYPACRAHRTHQTIDSIAKESSAKMSSWYSVLPEDELRVPERALPQEPPGRNQSLPRHGGFKRLCNNFGRNAGRIFSVSPPD
jgi:hypothetical protein